MLNMKWYVSVFYGIAKCSLFTIYGWLIHQKGSLIPIPYTELGVFVQTNFIKLCFEIRSCDPMNVKRSLYHCAIASLNKINKSIIFVKYFGNVWNFCVSRTQNIVFVSYMCINFSSLRVCFSGNTVWLLIKHCFRATISEWNSRSVDLPYLAHLTLLALLLLYSNLKDHKPMRSVLKLNCTVM